MVCVYAVSIQASNRLLRCMCIPLAKNESATAPAGIAVQSEIGEQGAQLSLGCALITLVCSFRGTTWRHGDLRLGIRKNRARCF